MNKKPDNGPSGIVELSAVQLSQAIHAREVSSAEVLDAKLLTGGSGYDVVFPASSGLGRAI